jgi:hypothetical protein
MGLNIKVTNSCKILALWANQYDITSTQADIVLTDMDGGGSYTAVMSYDAAGNGRINIPVENLTAPYGVFKVCLFENSIEYSCKPILIHCDIDCCLVKLTNELIDCSCDCPRCATALAKAQKIFLLLKSAESAVEIAGQSQSTGYFEDILDKYKKAKEICDNSCGCDC